jgi:hypothetical protein
MNLSEDERELLLTEVAQALDQVRSPELRIRYEELMTAVDQSEVPEDLLEPLQTLLEVGLESGRVRKVHLAPGEMAARRLFARTPKGKALEAGAAEVNRALEAVAGHPIEEARVAATGPGSFSLTLTTDEGTLLFQFSRAGVTLRSVEVG